MSGKVRLSIEVTRGFNEALERMATELGVTKSEAFRKGIALLSVAIEGKQRGERLFVIDKDGTPITRIVGF